MLFSYDKLHLLLSCRSSVLARVTYGENSMIDVEHVYYLLQAIYYKGTPESDQVRNNIFKIFNFLEYQQVL